MEYGSAVGRQELGKSTHFVGMQTGQQQGPGLGVRGGVTGRGIPVEENGQRT